jgi:hypothetical protein
MFFIAHFSQKFLRLLKVTHLKGVNAAIGKIPSKNIKKINFLKSVGFLSRIAF